MTSKKKIGLSLRGGGTLCTSYIGMFDALSERGLDPNVIIGSSAGALVGSAMALGMTRQQL